MVTSDKSSEKLGKTKSNLFASTDDGDRDGVGDDDAGAGVETVLGAAPEADQLIAGLHGRHVQIARGQHVVLAVWNGPTKPNGFISWAHGKNLGLIDAQL